MVFVRRYDTGSLRAPQEMPDGRLRVDGRLARTGVYVYRNADGTERREYRPPDEVFHVDALSSFKGVPLTDNHPPDGMVNDGNARALAVGWTGEEIRADGDRFVVAPIYVADADTKTKIRAGKTALSPGYTVKLDMTPGVTPDGERYDAVQREIRANHVALVTIARGGPDVRLRADADDAVMVSGPDDDEKSNGRRDAAKEIPMVKVKIDGVEYDASEQVAQAVGKLEAKFGAELQRANDEIAKAKGRADGLETALTEERGKNDPKRFAMAVAARVKLEGDAREAMGDADAKFDGLTDREVKIKVLGKLTPSAKFDGQADAYVDGRYDTAIELQSRGALASLRQTAEQAATGADGNGARNRGDDGETLDEDAARAEMIRAYKNASRTDRDDTDEGEED